MNERQSLISLLFLSLKAKNLRLTLSKRKLEAIEARLDEDSSRSFFISESWWSGIGDDVEWDHKLFLLDKTPPACLRMMTKMIAMMIIRMNRKLEDVVGTHRMLLSCWGEEFEDALYISGCVTIWCHTDLLASYCRCYCWYCYCYSGVDANDVCMSILNSRDKLALSYIKEDAALTAAFRKDVSPSQALWDVSAWTLFQISLAVSLVKDIRD